MSLTTKSEILVVLGELELEQPDLRVCQIIGNAVQTTDPYYVEDEELLEKLRAYQAHCRKHP